MSSGHITSVGGSIAKRTLQKTPQRPSPHGRRKKAKVGSDQDDDETMDDAMDDDDDIFGPSSSNIGLGKGQNYQLPFVGAKSTAADDAETESEDAETESEVSTPVKTTIPKGIRLIQKIRKPVGDDEDDDTNEDVLMTVSQGLTQVFDDVQKDLDGEEDSDSQQSNQVGQSQFLQTQQIQGKSLHDQYSERLINAYKEGLKPFVSAALDLEVIPTRRWAEDRQRADSICKYDDLIINLVIMLLQMIGDVLRHVIKGDLPKAAKKDSNLKKALYKLKNMSKKHRCPSTYGQYLVDKDGVSPTADQIGLILDLVEKYKNGYGVAHHPDYIIANKIDSAIGKPTSQTESRSGIRKYLAKAKQVEVCDAFIENTRSRIENLPGNEPLERPLAEIGYATYPVERLEQHKKHSSSNYLMNLTEAICAAYFPDFFIDQHVLFWHTHFTHAMFAEIILSAAGLVYTSTGGGFSHFPAGVSHNGAKDEKNEKGYYQKMEDEVVKGNMFDANVDEELRKISLATEPYKSPVANAIQSRGLVKYMENLAIKVNNADNIQMDLNHGVPGLGKELEGLTKPLEDMLSLA